MKTINIFNRKIPILAILMTLLIIGTASAAVFTHYASLSGTVTIDSSISVTDIDGHTLPLGGTDGILDFNSPATFTINNIGSEPVIVNLETILSLSIDNGDTWELVSDDEGLTVDYSVIDGTGVESGPVLVPPGGLTIDVEFDAVDNAVPGEYKIQVDVGVYEGTATFGDMSIGNYMQTISLAQKVSSTWQPVPDGNTASVNYIPMGNEFYYELSANSIPVDEYCLIYYADKEEPRDDNWGGDNPGAIIATTTTDINGDISISGIAILDMNLPHPDDCNGFYYEYNIEPDNYLNKHGAKLWLVPYSAINANYVSEDTQLVTTWMPGLILFEEELIHYTDTDL